MIDDVSVNISLNKRLRSSEWSAIEQNMPVYSKAVIKVLEDYTRTPENALEYKLDAQQLLGEEYYMKIRVLLERTELVPRIEYKPEETKAKKNTMKKKGKTKDEIIAETTNKILVEDTEKLISRFTDKIETNMNFLKSKYIELNGVILMHHASIIIFKQPEKYKLEKYRETVYEIIMSVKKFIEAAKTLKGKSIMKDKETEISSTFMRDIIRWNSELDRYMQIDGILIYKYAPRLMIYTNYDTLIPASGIKPRKYQMELIEKIRQNVDTGFFISLKAMLSSGKTTAAIVCISTIIEILNRTKSKEDRIQLIFTCNNNYVRTDAARIAYNGNIKFGVAGLDRTGENIKIVNQKNTEDADRVLIIASPEITKTLIETEERNSKIYGKNGKYWLFIDEPTIGAENIGSKILENNMSLLLIAPRHTIISSATMCELTEIPHIIDNIKSRHNGITFDTVYSDEIQIGCNVMTMSKKRVIPYAGCKTQKEITNVLSTIRKTPMLGRILTHEAIINLWENMTKYKIENMPNITSEFKNIHKITLDKMRLLCMSMLDILSKQNDNIIEKICNEESLYVAEEKKQDSVKKEIDNSFGFTFGDDEEENIPLDVIDANLFGTHQAHTLTGMNLIITPEPLDFARQKFEPLLKKIQANNTTAQKLYNIYEREKDEYKNKIDRLDKRVKSEDVRTKQIQEMDSSKPRIRFPDEYQINSTEHIKLFAKGKNKNIESVRPLLTLENIPYNDLQVDDWMVLLLYAGVGIVCPSKIQCGEYNTVVTELSANGMLAYTVADKTIGYGTNNPYIRVFEYTDKTTSINTLFQDMGRAGRVGQSWKAEAYIDDYFADLLTEYVKNPYAPLEAHNMQTVFDKLVSDKQKADIERQKLYMLKISKTEESKNTIKISDVKQRDYREQTDRNTIEITEISEKPITKPKGGYIPPHMRNRN